MTLCIALGFAKGVPMFICICSIGFIPMPIPIPIAIPNPGPIPLSIPRFTLPAPVVLRFLPLLDLLELLELLELDLDLECELFECELLSPIPNEAVTSLEGRLAGSGMHPACEGECNMGKGDRSVLEDAAKENTRAR